MCLIAVLFASIFAVVAPVTMRTSISFHHRQTVRQSRLVSGCADCSTSACSRSFAAAASARDPVASSVLSCSLTSQAACNFPEASSVANTVCSLSLARSESLSPARRSSSRLAQAGSSEFNGQLQDWLPTANHRYSRSRHGRPDELIVLDRERTRQLPPVSPEVVFRSTVRLPRDYYVRVFSNDYSVVPSFIGRIVDVIAVLETVRVAHDGVIIATHIRVWARHLVVTDPVHVARAAVMRRDFRAQRVHRPEPAEAVQVRDLAAYDEIFGIDLGQQPARLEVAS